jgi:hypothetical protein
MEYVQSETVDSSVDIAFHINLCLSERRNSVYYNISNEDN